ncbi:hypothetical protein ACFU6K_13130 [Kitasatospora sp. NPDC057512]|uniref:hypothetical protein n=1 Tax=Kitasatospora sp. NPDC057512 TaxID=3346154 RepID=UPI00368BCF2C
MVAVPASARVLVGVAIAVFTVPLVLVVARVGFRFSIAHAVAIACFVPCALALACARPNGFRAATVAAGCVLGPATVFAGFLLLMAGAGFGRADWILLAVTLPVAAIASLVGAFQRARGVEYGRRPAVIAWSAAALSTVGWPPLIFG